jgi:hypothetical protein
LPPVRTQSRKPRKARLLHRTRLLQLLDDYSLNRADLQSPEPAQECRGDPYHDISHARRRQTKSSRTLHPYFTPVAGSLSSNFGRTFAAFLATSRSILSETGTPSVPGSRCAMSGGVLGMSHGLQNGEEGEELGVCGDYVSIEQRKSCIPLVRPRRQDEHI